MIAPDSKRNHSSSVKEEDFVGEGGASDVSISVISSEVTPRFRNDLKSISPELPTSPPCAAGSKPKRINFFSRSLYDISKNSSGSFGLGPLIRSIASAPVGPL